tara:strand:- start:629 stop:1246 length:618 start_codon:yes stop_codon:yes gene_type:complete
MFNDVTSEKFHGIWSITLFRQGFQGVSEDIHNTEYLFARKSHDLYNLDHRKNKPIMKLQNGIISLLENNNIIHQTLEIGCVIEMSERKKTNQWIKLSKIASTVYDDDCFLSNGLYISDDGMLNFEFISMRFNPILPTDIWIRVRELNDKEIIWAINNEIFKGEKTRQLSLDNWTNLGIVENEKYFPDIDKIPLPGPPKYPYSFLQ